ncbi:MAG: FAD-dependent oxidoreductase [Clostridia bacterium]|nr:FAD-dependent oxidoreductase [Clostridia bacterium]
MLYNTVPLAIEGDGKVEALRVQNKLTEEESKIKTDAVFVAIGLSPDNERFSSLIDLDERGYIIAGESCEASLPGVWAVGDTRTKMLRQIITAASDGAVAGAAAAQYVKALGQ